MDKGLYGLYSWYEERLNNRIKQFSSNPRYVTKEINYIHELDNGKEIIDHLNSFISDGIYYKDIKSFKFQPYKIDDKKKDIIQEIINKTYFIEESDDTDIIDWLKLNILRRMKKRGYSEEVSKKYIDDYASYSEKLLKEIPNLNEKQKKALEKQSIRKCDNFTNTQPFTEEEFNDIDKDKYKKKLLLEDLLIPENNRQMILSSNKVNNNYKLNPKAIINPWISDFNMGYVSWNMVINKATISCLLNPEHESSNWLFPVRLILEKNPNDLFFENYFDKLNINTECLYLGFFLIKYELSDENIPGNIDEECKHLYSFAGSKPHKSKEQYYVMFVFENFKTSFKPFKYFIVNFRCNRIPWGDTGELTKILSSEIRQVNCMYVNDKVKLYLLLKKNKSGVHIKTINDLCQSQQEKITNDKKNYLDCNEAWLHKETFDLLIRNNILPYSDLETLHVFCTKKNIQEIFDILKSSPNITKKNIEGFEYIDLDEYILTECHFKWEADEVKEIIYNLENYYKQYQIFKNAISQIKEIINNLEQRDEYKEQMQEFKEQMKEFKKERNKYLSLYFELLRKYYQMNKQRFLIKHGSLDLETKEEYKKNFCITSKCISKLDDIRFNILQSLYNVDDIDKRFDYSPDYILSTNFKDIETSLQTGGNNDLSKLKFNKYVKKYYNLVDKYNKKYYNKNNINLSFNTNNILKNPTIKQLFYNKNKIIIKGEEYKHHTNFITNLGIFSITIIPFIKLNNILIISHNIAYVDKICNIFKNIKITLLVINNYEIGSFLTLKEKYNFIDIYFVGLYFNCLEQIKEICKNNIYDTIIIDPGRVISYQLISITLGILLCKDYLHKDGTYIHYCLLPDNINYTNNYIYIHYLLYKCFNYHINNDLNFYFLIKIMYPTILIYNNFKNNINEKEEKILLDILYDNYDNEIKLDITKDFDTFLLLRWKSIFFRSKEYFKIIKNQDQEQEGGYHRIAIKDMDIKIPETIDDLPYSSKFNGDAKDMPPLCHWGQKKLLLSEIQFFTNICKKLNIKNLKDYIVVYIGSADGTHLPILFNLFPELNWLLYDPNPFNKNVKIMGGEKVKIFNQYFLDNTIQHVFQHSLNKKILFISDIRVTPKDEQVMTDMINQAKWGIELSADFMLLKFRLPYNEPNSFTPKTIKDLKLNNNIINPDYIAKDTIYLKGTVYLQLYHPQYSTELRLLVEKNHNNKYELDNYDYIQIENKIFNYNSEIRPIAEIPEYKFLNLIPGFDKSIENIMEYEIIKQYYEYFHNIKDYKEIVKKLYDMNFYLEKLTHKKFIQCGLNSIDKLYYKSKKDNILRIEKIKLWKEISKMNICLLSKFQINYINKHGKKILGEERYNKALKYLTNNDTSLLYVKL